MATNYKSVESVEEVNGAQSITRRRWLNCEAREGVVFKWLLIIFTSKQLTYGDWIGRCILEQGQDRNEPEYKSLFNVQIKRQQGSGNMDPSA